MAHGVWASPDTIVFDSERAGSRHLFRMAIGDGVVTRMTTGSGQERASVSSDGQRVVSDNFDPSSNDRDLGLRTWSLAGVAIDAVTSPGDAAGVSGATQASFSPDGRSIAFVQKSDFNADRGAIFVVDAAGGEPRRLTPDADHVGYPRWSPDGLSILFTQGAGPLLIIDVGSGKVRPLVDPGEGSVAFEGDWSPDGTQIAYAYLEPWARPEPAVDRLERRHAPAGALGRLHRRHRHAGLGSVGPVGRGASATVARPVVD